ncbi:MAG TPA: MoaD/ThiS family protein [Casimicrobiaceae bacterium]|nr:MoaD/ThiS family protein [Casimicrobiaceae bacterium]
MPDSRASDAVTIRLVYLARLREAFGSSGESLSLASSGEPSTVATVLDRLRERGGPFAAELARGRAVRIAVNHELAGTEVIVRDGDEVALFPPVTGG